jgi:Zn-dependent metalloprotease
VAGIICIYYEAYFMKPVTLLMIIFFSIVSGCAESPMANEGLAAEANQNEVGYQQLVEQVYHHFLPEMAGIGLASTKQRLSPASLAVDDYGTKHLKFTQHHVGVLIWGSELIVHFRGTNIYRIDGSLRPEIDIDVTPEIPIDKAKEAAIDAIGAEGMDNVSKVDLVVLPMDSGDFSLCYLMELTKGLRRYFVFVDANSGEVVKRLDGTPS